MNNMNEVMYDLNDTYPKPEPKLPPINAFKFKECKLSELSEVPQPYPELQEQLKNFDLEANMAHSIHEHIPRIPLSVRNHPRYSNLVPRFEDERTNA